MERVLTLHKMQCGTFIRETLSANYSGNVYHFTAGNRNIYQKQGLHVCQHAQMSGDMSRHWISPDCPDVERTVGKSVHGEAADIDRTWHTPR